MNELSLATGLKPLIDGVLSALESTGWTRGEGTAIATKSFDTVNGANVALAFITEGDGINRTLSFQYMSEGGNVAAADLVVIPVGATAAQASALAIAAASRAEASIQGSYGVRIRAMQDAGRRKLANLANPEQQDLSVVRAPAGPTIQRIFLKSQQTAARTYNAMILIIEGMRFSRDLLDGAGGDRDLRVLAEMAASSGVAIECHEPALQARLPKPGQ